ncbi:MAG: SMC-Scp complex subunit ScpB [Actinomycetota bacterium]|nr:SMC-Scp complex subunit ScpB [Actinomycetota bacterium]
MVDHNIKSILESLLFVCDEPLSLARAAAVVEKSEAEVKEGLEELADDFRRGDRGIQLRRVAGGWRLYTHPGHAPYIEKLVISWDSRRLTKATLETLAIIGYKQPITKVSIGGIRGVNSDGAVASLLAKGLIKEMGREKSPGSPILYGTSILFLEKFGLNSLKDLPPLAEFEPDPMARGEIEAGLDEEGAT